MKALKMVAIWLLIIGGLNWGLTALGWNVVDMIFGTGSTLSMIIYLLVGLAAIYKIVLMFSKNSTMSSSGGMM